MAGKILNPNIIELEGLAMVGKILKIELVKCEEENVPEDWLKIRAYLKDGKIVESGCIEPDAAKRNAMVIRLYVRNWAKDLVRE